MTQPAIQIVPLSHGRAGLDGISFDPLVDPRAPDPCSQQSLQSTSAWVSSYEGVDLKDGMAAKKFMLSQVQIINRDGDHRAATYAVR